MSSSDSARQSRERHVMAGVEFEKITTPQADQQEILDALGVKLQPFS